jgi:HSP20 family protein
MEKEGGAGNDSEDVMGKYGWFKPSKAFMAVSPSKGEKWMPSIYEPHAEMTETANEVLLRVELPGVKKENIDISATEDRLDVGIEEGSECEELSEAGEYTAKCRYTGFRGSYVTPSGIDTSMIKATYSDGILEIRAKKSGLDRRKKIEIE